MPAFHERQILTLYLSRPIRRIQLCRHIEDAGCERRDFTDFSLSAFALAFTFAVGDIGKAVTGIFHAKHVTASQLVQLIVQSNGSLYPKYIPCVLERNRVCLFKKEKLECLIDSQIVPSLTKLWLRMHLQLSRQDLPRLTATIGQPQPLIPHRMLFRGRS